MKAAKPPKVVLYKGQNKYKVEGQHEPPTDAEGKPVEVVDRREMTPREHMGYVRAMWSRHNAGRPHILRGP